MAFGVTLEGFNRKRLIDIKKEVEDTLKTILGSNINLLPEAVYGQLVGVFSERESDIWELSNDNYDSQYPDSAEGVNLDNVSSITGSVRKAATFSTVTAILFGTPGTIVPLDSTISVNGSPLNLFNTLAAVTIGIGVDEIQDIDFDAVPDVGSFKITFRGTETTAINFNDNNTVVQAALNALPKLSSVVVAGSFAAGFTITFSGNDGKRNQEALTITSNILQLGATPVNTTVVETTPGEPQATVNLQAQVTGPTVAPAETLTEIETPITGWDSVLNEEDATTGQDEEKDADFRIRRKQEVAKAGAATPNAVFADVSSVENVTAVVVFFNNLDIADIDGRPPHSVDIVVQGGDEDVLAQAIFDTVGGGITFFGDVIKVLKDDQDFDQTIKFSRPTPIDIYFEMDLTVDPDVFPVDGIAQVQNGVLAYGAELSVGEDIIVYGSDPSLSCSFGDVKGILDYTIRVGKAAAPALDDNIVTAAKELAEFDSSRITIITL